MLAVLLCPTVVATHRSRAATVRRKRLVCDANTQRNPLSRHRKLLSHFAPYLQKLPNVQASTAANQPLHTPISPFTRASKPISSLGGVREVAGEKKTERTTRLLLTNEIAAISQTPPRIIQLPSRWRQGRNGPGAGLQWTECWGLGSSSNSIRKSSQS